MTNQKKYIILNKIGKKFGKLTKIMDKMLINIIKSEKRSYIAKKDWLSLVKYNTDF